jgi:glycerate kinase
MKILVAPNAFKGCLSARDAARAIRSGAEKGCPGARIDLVPFADGGDGLIDVLADVLSGEIRTTEATGPLGEASVQAPYCVVPGLELAAVEMARASGLALLAPAERDPLRTTTLGTGELMAAALGSSIRRLVVGIGGSATNDGGVGMAAALGVRFLDERGRSVVPVGGELGRIRRIDLSGRHPELERVEVEGVCDVDNPLLGPHGATRVYGPQKGAGAEDMRVLEEGLCHLADVIERDCGLNVRSLPGAGAAGGLGAGLAAFAGASLRRGVDVMLDLTGLERAIPHADLVLTGEGRFDIQATYGKGPAGVAACARKHGVPCAVLSGSVSPDVLPHLDELGVSACFGICPGPLSPEEAFRDASRHLERTAENVVRLFRAGHTDVPAADSA